MRKGGGRGEETQLRISWQPGRRRPDVSTGIVQFLLPSRGQVRLNLKSNPAFGELYDIHAFA